MLLPRVCDCAWSEPPSCEWVPTCEWGACICAGSRCGPGVQQRTVGCKCNGKIVADRHCKDCPGPKPVTSRRCVDTSKCKHEWVYSDWSACDRDCKRHRKATCMFGPEVARDPKKCGPCAEDQLHQDCPDDDPTRKGKCKKKVECEWTDEKWCECDAKCDGGWRTRPEAKCVPVGPLRTDKYACDVCSKKRACKPPAPSTREKCNTQACLRCDWQFTGPFCPCSKPCGEGQQSREAQCGVASAVPVDKGSIDAPFVPCPKPKLCKGTKPVETKPCTLGPCCKWSEEAWCDCDKKCGGGVQTRPAAKCVPDTSAPSPSSASFKPASCQGQCKGLPRPDTTQACNTQDCKAKPKIRVCPRHIERHEENEPFVPSKPWINFYRGRPLTLPDSAGTLRTGPVSPPLGQGSFEFVTDAGEDKGYLFNYDHQQVPLTSINRIKYSTYRTQGDLQQVTSINLQVDVNGAGGGDDFTTLVYEPVYNNAQAPQVMSGVWQTWDAYNGAQAIWWSSRNIPDTPIPADVVIAANTYLPWSKFMEVLGPMGAVLKGGVGLNQGSGNPNLIAAADAFELGYGERKFRYNFEPCKKGDVPAPDEEE